MHADIGHVVHRPKALFDDMPLQRRVVPEVRDEFFEGIGVKDRSLNVFRTRIFAALELENLEAFLGHSVGCGVARRPGAYHNSVEAFLDHVSASFSRPADLPTRCLRKRLRQGRQEPDGVRDNTKMSKVEDRRVRIGIDRDNHVRALDPYPVLDRTGDSSCDIELRPDSFARSVQFAGPTSSSLSGRGAANRHIPHPAPRRAPLTS